MAAKHIAKISISTVLSFKDLGVLVSHLTGNLRVYSMWSKATSELPNVDSLECRRIGTYQLSSQRLGPRQVRRIGLRSVAAARAVSETKTMLFRMLSRQSQAWSSVSCRADMKLSTNLGRFRA